jgi:hypothetical protein
MAAVCGVARGQDIEPRLYSNVPVGLNYAIGAYAYAKGRLAFDPSLPIVDAQYRSDAEILGYLRSFDWGGKSAKLDVVLPYSSFSANALVMDEPRERVMSGLADPRIRLSVNLYGAPALTLKDFRSYEQDLIVGASLQVSVPWGQYDNSKLLNLGNNRWSFKPELGISKRWDDWIFELMPSVTFYSDNTDFNRGNKLTQEPLYAVQFHVVRNLPRGMWVSFGGTVFRGNRTALNGVKADNLQDSSRAGMAFSMPVNRANSVKFAISGGTHSRTGAHFDAASVSWVRVWGEGL